MKEKDHRYWIGDDKRTRDCRWRPAGVMDKIMKKRPQVKWGMQTNILQVNDPSTGSEMSSSFEVGGWMDGWMDAMAMTRTL